MPKGVTGARNLLLMITLLDSMLFARAFDKEMTIDIMYLDTRGYYAEVRQGVQDAAEDSSVQVQLIETNAQDGISKESTFINTPVERNVDAIILSAVSENGSSHAVRHTSEVDVSVICYSTCIDQKDVDKYVSAYLVGDPLEFGKRLSNAAADYFIASKIDQPKVAVISCEAFGVCVQCRKGSEEVLKIHIPDAQIVASQEETVLDKAISVGEKLIISTPDLSAIMGESSRATLNTVKTVCNQNQAEKIAVFDSDMTTEVAQELENNQVLRAVVGISGKETSNAVFVQTLKVTNKQADGEKVIQVPIDLYARTEDGKQWLAIHVDGLPQSLIRRGPYVHDNRGSPGSKSGGRK